MSFSPRLAVSIGCPSGIGPEVSLVAARQAAAQGLHVGLIGDIGALARAAQLCGIAPSFLECRASFPPADAPCPGVFALCPTPPLAASDMQFGDPSRAGGAAQLAWVDAALDLVVDGRAAALVTGPVSKHAIAHSGAPSFTGHTEHLARRLGVDRPVMVFVSGHLAVALVTTHLPIAQVAHAIDVRQVQNAVEQCAKLLIRLGHSRPRVAVCGLNPHAGEAGLLGDEELRVVGPGTDRARQALLDQGLHTEICGPIGAETAFRLTFDGAFEGVVAMYHDQATVPMKLQRFGRAVNVTAGLPIVRTSVDHGTGYDRAGQGNADAGSMLEAMLLAARLTRSTALESA